MKRAFFAELLFLALIIVTTGMAFGCSNSLTAPSAPAVVYSVTGTAKTVELQYTTPEGTLFTPDNVPLPFTYSRTATPGDYLALLVSITSAGDTGNARASISKNGVEVATQT